MGRAPQAWRAVTWAQGIKATLAARFVARPLRLCHGRGDRWVLSEWSLADDTRKHYVLNVEATASLRQLIRLARNRWPIEQYRELKDELGLDRFEGRAYSGWAHHTELTTAASSSCNWNGIARQTRREPPCPPCGRGRGK